MCEANIHLPICTAATNTLRVGTRCSIGQCRVTCVTVKMAMSLLYSDACKDQLQIQLFYLCFKLPLTMQIESGLHNCSVLYNFEHHKNLSPLLSLKPICPSIIPLTSQMAQDNFEQHTIASLTCANIGGNKMYLGITANMWGW